jgi:hypothetical protein
MPAFSRKTPTSRQPNERYPTSRQAAEPFRQPDGRYLTFRQAAERYLAFSEAGLRWLRFNGTQNGFNACVIKIGRRVLLDTDAFEPWLLSHKAEA